MKSVSTRFAAFSTLFAACLAIGCSGKQATTQATTQGTTQTALQAFQSLQASGQIPILDTTTSLTGTDADNDGIRDDIDKYIASLPDTTAQKKALSQMAQALQVTLSVDTTNASALAAASLALNRGDKCIWQVYTSGQSSKALAMEEFTMNTMPRLVAYDQYNAARNGAVITLASGTVCN